jgi:hypothetical protein
MGSGPVGCRPRKITHDVEHDYDTDDNGRAFESEESTSYVGWRDFRDIHGCNRRKDTNTDTTNETAGGQRLVVLGSGLDGTTNDEPEHADG